LFVKEKKGNGSFEENLTKMQVKRSQLLNEEEPLEENDLLNPNDL